MFCLQNREKIMLYAINFLSYEYLGNNHILIKIKIFELVSQFIDLFIIVLL